MSPAHTHDVSTGTSGECVELIARDPVARCGLAGESVSLACPAGRPDATGGPYCPEHGGGVRAEREARADWNFLAPASVGHRGQVLAAGCEGLLTPDRYIVVRQLIEPAGGVWLAWLGLGSAMLEVSNPESAPNRRRGGVRHRRAKDRGLMGTRSFRTREDALRVARDAWARQLAAHVERIRVARGGTLDWGVPVEPAEEPIVIVLEQGEARSAWDLAVVLPRMSRDGLSLVSGLRPSGEVA